MNFGRPSPPGAEGAARARQNDRVHLFVDREVKPDRAQLAMEHRVDRVERIRAVERHGRDPVRLFDLDCFVLAVVRHGE
jgi:hypothetical protein